MRSREKGSILIASLWILSILSINVASLNRESFVQVGVMKREIEDLQIKANFLSGVSLVTSIILSDSTPYVDSKKEELYGVIDEPRLVDDRLIHSITVTDEESKINLNFAKEEQLRVFFEKFEENFKPLRTDPENLTEEILKKRQEQPFISLEELLLIEDFYAQDLERLRPYITVYPDLQGMNLHTVELWILEALLESLYTDNFARNEFLRKLELFRERGSVLSSDDLRFHSLIQKLELKNSPQMNDLVQRLLLHVTSDSRTFSVLIETHGRRGHAILAQRTNKDLEILSWREN